jgi:hypothetical protein
MKKFNEAEYLKQESAIKDLRSELDAISDDDLLLFQARIYNERLQSVAEFIETKASEESDAITDSKARGCGYDF